MILSNRRGLPQTEGNVYMNYTSSSNEAYTELDLSKKSTDNVYASLS